MIIERKEDFKQVKDLLRVFPVAAILGPRQVGKTTLAREFGADEFFDFENPQDAAVFAEPLLGMERLKGLVVFDEIQRVPDIFPVLRHVVDKRKDVRFLILGSASRDLLQQSSESLAGRIGYHELGGFGIGDVGAKNWQRLWLRGGLPPAYLARNDADAGLWREQYIRTFLERDIPQLGITIPAATLRRFWLMLCHYHGQVMNYAEFATSFGVSDATVRRYLDILAGTFMVRILQPWHGNIAKRLVKRPKIYLRDSGLLHSLISVGTERELSTHSKLGASWEGFALENVCRAVGKEEMFFWATHSGAEVDLFWQEGGKNWAVEFKYADAPEMTRSMHSALADLDLAHLWVVYPGERTYSLAPRVTALPIASIGAKWKYNFL